MVRTSHQERSHLELITVYEISRILGASLDLQRSFRAALNVLTAHIELPRAMIVLPDDDEHLLRVHSAVGLNREQSQRGVWHAFSAREGRMMAFLVVPIKTEAAVLGVLAAQRPVEGMARLSDDQRILKMVAGLMAQTLVLARAVNSEHQRLQRETTRLQKALAPEPRGRYALDNVVGVSRAMQQVFAEVHQAAPSRATVLLRGESGTGKEAIARAIHYLSPRKDAPFIKVNCAALTESLLESELFGHERGAFTGAAGDRKGRFEQAHTGSLFLDEVGDISPAFQAKLLRVLQEREFERVGGNRSIKVDVRLICATNRDLEKMVKRGEYRADLYYRINVVSISLPALRERREDIPPLVAHFVDRYNKENHRKLKVASDAMEVITHCYWPGNVRELENCIERTATMVQGEVIHAIAFPCRHNRCLTQTLHHVDKEDAVAPIRMPVSLRIPVRESPRPGPEAARPADADAGDAWDEDEPAPHGEVLRIGPTEHLTGTPRRFGNEPPEGERERLIWAMEQCAWVQAKAARLLRITPRQLGYALRKYNIEVHKL
jgi:Nif-specific regulatory protein